MEPNRMDGTNRLDFLDFLRASGAVLVLLHHLYLFWYRGGAASVFPFLISEKEVTGLELINFYPIMQRIHLDIGKLGVSLFFLITGFLCNNSLRKQSPGEFFINKIIRIYPVYIVGFSMTYLAIFLYLRGTGQEFPYDFKNWLIQVSLLREWFWMPSIDGLSWTLEQQMKFYLLIMFLAILKKQQNAKMLILLGIILAVTSQLISVNMDRMYQANMTFWWRFGSGVLMASVCLIYMLIGAAIYQHQNGCWTTVKLMIVLLVLYCCFVFAAVSFTTDATELVLNYSIGLFIFLSCYILSKNGGTTVFRWRIVSFLSKISYPLYVVHGIIGFIIMTWLYNLGWNSYLCFSTAVIVVVFLATILHALVEKPAGKLARRVIMCFSR